MNVAGASSAGSDLRSSSERREGDANEEEKSAAFVRKEDGAPVCSDET
jgi:hypothetical protein